MSGSPFRGVHPTFRVTHVAKRSRGNVEFTRVLGDLMAANPQDSHASEENLVPLLEISHGANYAPIEMTEQPCHLAGQSGIAGEGSLALKP